MLEKYCAVCYNSKGFLGLYDEYIGIYSREAMSQVIEEIDNGIHPSRVYKLIEQLHCIGKERNIDFIITTHNAALLNAYKKEELVGVSVVYREKEKRTSKIISFVDIDNFPSMLVSGGLGNAMIDARAFPANG